MQTKESQVAQRLVPLVLGVFAFLVFATGAFYGLPQQWDADEQIFVHAALTMLVNQTLDPGWYGAPASTLITGLALLYGMIGVVGHILGFFEDGSAFISLYFEDATLFHAAGRLMVAGVAAACIVVIDRITRELQIDLSWRVFTLALFILSPIIIKYSSLIRMEMLQVLFGLLSIYFCLRYLRSEKPAIAIALAGACLGLAVASKYPAVIGALPIALTTILRASTGEETVGRAAGHLLIAASASLVGAFVAGPYLFMNFAGVLQDVAREARPTHLSATSPGLFSAIWYYLSAALTANLGILLMLVGLTGLAWMSMKRRTAVVPLFFVAYVVFISSLNLMWERWSIPVIPMLIIAAGFLLNDVSARLRRAVSKRAADALLVIVFVLTGAPLAQDSYPAVLARLTDRDTRAEAAAWIDTAFPNGARVLLETGAPSLSVHEHVVFVTNEDAIVPWASVSQHARPIGFYGSLAQGWRRSPEALIDAADQQGIDLLVVSTWYRRFNAESDRYPREAQLYETILDRLTVVQRIDGGDGMLGPSIMILALPPDG